MGHVSVKRLLFFPVPVRRTWLFLPFDLLAITFATIFSFELRFNWTISQQYDQSFWELILIRPFIYLVCFLGYRLYTRAWRYATPKDFKALVWAVTVASFATKIIDWCTPNVTFPNSIWLSCYLLTLVLTGGARAALKTYGTVRTKELSLDADAKRQRILIYGAGSAGLIVSREAERDFSGGWDIVGFVDDDRRKQGLILNGLPILGTGKDVAQIIQTRHIERILIAIPSMGRAELRAVVDELNTYNIPILIIPPFTKWAVNNLFSQVRPVDVEDLLGRDPLPTDTAKIGEYLRGAVVLVTGAGGSIGSEICRQVALMNPQKLVILGRGENSIFEIQRELKELFPRLMIDFVIGDIRDKKKMSTVFDRFRPNVVFHAAAHKHVPLMEQHPDEAYVNNIRGTRILSELAGIYSVERFILISSDKAVRPTNVMGASKRVAEMVMQDMAHQYSGTMYVGVRFGNVLGSRGSVVRVFRDQIAKGGPITVTDERMQRYFMTIPEAVRLVLEAGAAGVTGNIYLLDMGEPVRIVDLAERMIRLSGFTPGVDIPIEVTGIRPGEKLFEELSRESDSISVDPNERIWSVSCPILSPSEFDAALEHLDNLYYESDLEELGEAIKQLAWWEPLSQDEVAAADVTDAVMASTTPSLAPRKVAVIGGYLD